MKSRRNLSSLAGALTLVVLICGLPITDALDEEFDELTTAAAAAVKKSFPTATIMGVGQEREQGVLYYEVVLRDRGERVEVEVTPDGAIGEIESVVSIADVPQAAREQILRNVLGTDVTRVERHEVRGAAKGGTFVPVNPPAVFFEVEYQDNGRWREFLVAEDGTRPRLEEDDEEDDDEDDG
jgi:hypothetical protein